MVPLSVKLVEQAWQRLVLPSWQRVQAEVQAEQVLGPAPPLVSPYSPSGQLATQVLPVER